MKYTKPIKNDIINHFANAPQSIISFLMGLVYFISIYGVIIEMIIIIRFLHNL
jgi:hypothetical protein